ncbi:MAG: pseudouridine-5'-phosphate glycosidase [Chloracidobacterium sp.]|nr:pseudouridine-5'-phosphate glycosidase [Chloracidobacterium sp.]
MKLNFSEEVSGALHFDRPVVALESTVIAHGLPFPQNIDTAYKLERIVRDNGAVPATIGVFDGQITVGLNDEQIELLATSAELRKLSIRDLPVAIASKGNGATTVASTAFIAKLAGINVFATGGIGGVHRGSEWDVSADLPVLAETPVLVVCSGAKVVLDLPATREWLETHGVPVLGWNCDEMPAFYSLTSGLAVDGRVESEREVAEVIKARESLGMRQAVLLTVPVPEHLAIAEKEMSDALERALTAAADGGVSGKEVTPFLLSRINEITAGRSLEANIALLENNARIAAAVACQLDR